MIGKSDLRAMATDNTKQLRIQTGVVKRLGKEKLSYIKEMELNTAKIEKLREAGKDEYDIKQAIAVLDETKMIIPETERKLLEAYQNLDQLVQGSADKQDTTEYKEAVEVLENTKDLLPVQ